MLSSVCKNRSNCMVTYIASKICLRCFYLLLKSKKHKIHNLYVTWLYAFSLHIYSGAKQKNIINLKIFFRQKVMFIHCALSKWILHKYTVQNIVTRCGKIKQLHFQNIAALNWQEVLSVEYKWLTLNSMEDLNWVHFHANNTEQNFLSN